MNRLVKDMLMSKYGGDSAYDYTRSDYASDYRRRDMQRGDSTYAQPYPDMYDRHYEYPQQFEDRRRYDMRRDRRDYDDYYRRDRRDYGKTRYGKMSDEDIKNWEHALINSDGTHGAHFKKEMIDPIVNKLHIDVHKYGGLEQFAITMNAMYADYCTVAKKFGVDIPDFYADLAKAFLEDKDFKGNGEEKLWLYYKCIAEQED